MGERIHYGSLEDVDFSFTNPSKEEKKREGVTLAFSEKTVESQKKYLQDVESLELKKKSRGMTIPTDDKSVKERLRELGEPIILFGEQAPERRERLRNELTKRGREGYSVSLASSTYANEKDELFYTEGSTLLKNARLLMARESLPKARSRLLELKRKREQEQNDNEKIKTEGNSLIKLEPGTEESEMQSSFETDLEKKKSYTSLYSTFGLVSSIVGDDRVLSSCSFSPDGNSLATSSWGGIAKIWDFSSGEMIQTLKGHQERITNIQYYPQMKDVNSLGLASGSADKNICLWSSNSSSPLHTLEGHTDWVNHVAFHPSGRFLGSASRDLSWKLWDLETAKELIDQEGHSKSVISLAFQPDGSLAASGGEDKVGRVWDLRSGKSIWVFRGHSERILSIDFSPNGYQFASAAEDNSIRIWDLRKRRYIQTIPAHSRSITQVKYHPTMDLMISCSIDKTMKIWATCDFTRLKTFNSTATFLGIDISPNGSSLASVHYDKNWKKYTHDELLSYGK
eukprot:TRINITY_DN1925_c0_g1_i3.p1 TRINITY_DN1925_c0_g1~~TRINITY_DN1925_c0_g1_i3.p1  ORF type:complete len:512 (-),score=148.91 TRINITY_DN1925_c0_g1_i3:9-1544(-)